MMTRPPKSCDVAIIGGGPAGLTAAYFAAERGLKTAVIERNATLAKKLRITGKGRCNLTNDCDTDVFLDNVRRGEKFLRSSVSSFSSGDVMSFFQSRGLQLVTERGARVFPKSRRADDVAETLIEAARDAGAHFCRGRAVDIGLNDGAVAFVTLQTGERITCRAAVIATGGASYPGTGSTGDGYRIAEKLSHRVIPPKASLVPIECRTESALQGLALKNVELIAAKGNKLIYRERGELIFTHFGVSGPLVLSLSSHLVGEELEGFSIYIDLKPALDEETLDRRVQRVFSENLNRYYINSLGALLPKKIITPVAERSGIDLQKRVNVITSAERASLVRTMKHFSLAATSLRPVEEAVVTAGGVALAEIDPKTMMSKKVQNLHFAGEVMDADGYTGGFNLGIAFATGAAAGRNVLDI